MQIISREMRGIPYFLLKEYLQELGGALVEENFVRGDGWSVRLTKMEPYKFHSLQVGQTRLEMELEDHVADDFLQRFGMKTLRAGA
ncbi:MAG: DUF1952 domain-containing protein [Chloroflexi bacterium]|nr:DUF1952 domain-containing protein [Chloroflexota bacterium]